MNDNLVYKYYSNESEYAFENFKNDLISFTPISSLNDPLEGYGSFDFELKYDRSEDENKSEEQKQKEKEAKRNTEKTFYNDVYKKEIEFNTRVFCASKGYDNSLLWSYYANSHKGFCVGYQKSDIELITKRKMFDIIYENEIYEVNNENFEKNGQINYDEIGNILARKSDLWNHENECRAMYVLNTDNNIDITHFTPELHYKTTYENKNVLLLENGYLERMCSQKYILKHCEPAVIYLGAKMNDERMIREFREIAHRKNINIYKMNQIDKTFEFEALDL